MTGVTDVGNRVKKSVLSSPASLCSLPPDPKPVSYTRRIANVSSNQHIEAMVVKMPIMKNGYCRLINGII